MFTGQIVSAPVGYSGYNANQNVSTLQPDELIQSDNTSYALGTLQKEGGSQPYTPNPLTGAPIVVGGHDWFPNLDTTQRSIIICSDKRVLKDSGGGTYSTTLATLTSIPNSTPVFVEGGRESGALNRKLFMYTGSNQVQTLSGDGATCANIANPPTDWIATPPLGGCIHLNRHIGFGGSNPHYIYGSDNSDHEDFGAPQTFLGASTTGSKVLTGAPPALLKVGDNITGVGLPDGTIVNIIDRVANNVTVSNAATATNTGVTFTYTNPNVFNLPVYPGVGEKIVAVLSFKGKLIVGKYPRGIYFVDMSAADRTQWFTVQLSIEVGFAGPLSWCPVDDDILFMDAQGNIHMLSSVLEFGDYGLRSVSDIAWMRNYVLNNANMGQLTNSQCIFYLAKREAHFALTPTGNSINSLRLVVDFNRIDRIRFRYATKDKLASLWLARDSNGIPRITGGDNAGRVWTLDQDNKSINGIGYNSVFQTAHLDFSHIDPSLGAKRKNFKFLEIVGEPEGNWSIGIDVYIDGKYSQTLLYNLGAAQVGLGNFTLGSSPLAGSAVLAGRKRMVGGGKRVSLVGNLSGPAQDYSLSKFIFYFTVGGESDVH